MQNIRKKKNEVFMFLRNILLIFIDILETQTSFIIPNFCYCTIIGIYFLQIIANIMDFSDSENISIRYLTSFSQSSTLTYFLLDSTSYYKTWIAYLTSHAILYFLWIFIIYSAYNKMNNPIKFQEKTPFEVVLKEILRTYITAYFYFFYEPYNKINLGIMIKGNKCLLPIDQDSIDQPYTNVYALVLGGFGCITNILMTSLTIYFFRNFEFHDTNSFKRKHSPILYLILLIRFLISIMFTLSSGTVGILHFLCHLLGFTVIYDALFIRPFLNQRVCKFYIIAAMMYEFGCICLTLLKFTDFFGPLNVLYTYLWLGPMVGCIAVLLSERFYHRSLYIMPNTIEQKMEIFDLYTEEVIRLYKDSYFSDESKFLILSLFRFHIIDCMSPDCFCLKYGSDNLEKKHAKKMFAAIYVYTEINQRVLKNITLSMPQLLKIVDSMFKIALDKPKILGNSNHYENISLKYISFINKYMENSLLSYFFLKKLGKNQQQLSYFFSLLFEIYSDKLKYQMRQMNESMANKGSANLDNNLKFIETIQQIEEFTLQFTQQIIEIINLKSKIWDIFYKGANTMDELFSNIKQKLNIILLIKNNMIWQFKSSFLLSSQTILMQNAAYIKLHQVFEMFIMNDTLKVKKMEGKIIDQRKRDQYKEEIFLNNYNYMAGSSVIIKAGLSLENGKILNRKNTKIAEFFGFSAHEMDQIRTINDVMPRHISVLHNQILAQYLTKGYSSLMTTSRKIFLINKEKFLFPCSIQVRNDFTNLSDCVFNATLLKTQANRELVMFDEFGRVLSITKNLFNAISRNRQTRATLFTYDQMREKCLLFLLCPTLAKIFQSNLTMMKEAESKDDVVCMPIANLMCSLFTSSDMIDFSNTYKSQLRTVGNLSNNPSQINNARSLQDKESGWTNNSNINQSEMGGSTKTSSLVDEVDLVNMKKFIQENKDKYRNGSNIQRFKMRFTLHFFFRNFANIDNRVLKSIVGNAKQVKEYLTMRYFVIECQEINKTKIVPTRGQFETIRTSMQATITNKTSPNPEEAESQDSSENSSPLENKQSEEQDNQNNGSLQLENDSISEGKIKLNINNHDLEYNDQQMIQNMSQISLKLQNNYEILEQNVFSQIISPKGTENQLINQFSLDIDIRKQNMIQRMLQFENKWENKPQVFDIEPQVSKQVTKQIPNYSEKQISEQVSEKKILESPEMEQQMPPFQVPSELNGDNDEIVENDDNQEDQVQSFNEGSDEEIEEIEDFQVADFKKKVIEEVEVRNEKRVKFDMDCSSQSSRFSTSGGQNVNDIYLNHKMPSQYRRFLFTIAIFLITILASMIAIVSISSIGFSRFDFFNEFIETSYLLHSHFCEAVFGTYYLKLTELNIIPPVPYLNSTLLFEFNIAHSKQTMVEDYQEHFQMIQRCYSVINSVKTALFTTNDTLIYLDLDLISYCNNQIELMKSLPLNMLSLRSLILRISTSLELTGIINEKIESDLTILQNDLVDNIFMIFYISCIILGFQTFQMGLAYKNFIEFQEKVLLLVTRVNLAEYEQEVAKLKYAKDIIKNMDGSSVVTQDFLPNLIYFNLSKNQKDEENQMEMAQQSNEVKEKKKSTHHSKGNTLSSKIYNPKLSVKFSFIKLIVILQITIIYLVGGLIITLNVPSLYKGQSEITIDILKGFTYFQTINIYSLLLVSGSVFGEQVYGMAPSSNQIMDLNRTEIYDDYQKIKLLEHDFITRQSTFIYYESSSNIFSHILFKDLCLIPLQKDFTQQICNSPLSNFFKKGLQGLQIQSNSFMDSYNILIRDGGTQDMVTKFLEQDDYWAFQSTFFVFMQEYMLCMKDLYLSKYELVKLTLRLKDTIQQYMIVTGIALTILLASYFFKSIIVLNRNIECVEYLLCFIPTNKLSEPATIQMIKAIQNF